MDAVARAGAVAARPTWPRVVESFSRRLVHFIDASPFTRIYEPASERQEPPTAGPARDLDGVLRRVAQREVRQPDGAANIHGR